jgi:hypothetical protein
MWTKITSPDQLKTAGLGTLLIKYPLSGGVATSLDITDKEKISVRYVTKNSPSYEEFDMSLIPYQIEHFIYMISGIASTSFAEMHKKYTDIISEGNYWIYRG